MRKLFVGFLIFAAFWLLLQVAGSIALIASLSQ